MSLQRSTSLQRTEPEIVLASASTARAAVLRSAGITFRTRPPMIDEAGLKRSALAEGASADDTALLLAEAKALTVARRQPSAFVIGADQLLVCAGQRFDKPTDRAEARTQLLSLSGRAHTLVTAMVCARNGERIWHHIARPVLRMRRFSEVFLDAYLDAEGDAILSCVGAYRVEARGAQLFDALDGEYTAVLGLPLLPLLGYLRQHGLLLE